MLERFGSRVIEITFVILVITLVLQNAGGFSQVVGAIGNVYTSGVSALRGK